MKFRRTIVLFLLSLSPVVSFSATAPNPPADTPESVKAQVRRAFSLVGHWDITKMDVRLEQEVVNGMKEAPAAAGEMRLVSTLGEYGSFDVSPGGSISGDGQANYEFRVAAGSAAFSGGPATSPIGLSVTIPVGAAAALDPSQDENGVRKFSITGNADLEARTIALNSFKPAGGPLKVVIRPGGSRFTFAAWPPMTNVSATKVIVQGSSLLLRAKGNVGRFVVTFEAVKFVNLEPLFTTLLTLAGQAGPAGAPGTTGAAGGAGPKGDPGSSGGSGGGSASSPLAGTVKVPIGGSAVVKFNAPLASAKYAVSLTPASAPAFQGSITYSDKTPAGFTVRAASASAKPGEQISVDWIAIPY